MEIGGKCTTDTKRISALRHLLCNANQKSVGKELHINAYKVDSPLLPLDGAASGQSLSLLQL